MDDERKELIELFGSNREDGEEENEYTHVLVVSECQEAEIKEIIEI